MDDKEEKRKLIVHKSPISTKCRRCNAEEGPIRSKTTKGRRQKHLADALIITSVPSFMWPPVCIPSKRFLLRWLPNACGPPILVDTIMLNLSDRTTAAATAVAFFFSYLIKPLTHTQVLITSIKRRVECTANTNWVAEWVIEWVSLRMAWIRASLLAHVH